MQTFKLLSILFCLILGISCSSNKAGKKIGFLIRTYQLDRCVKERDFFTEKINQLGAEVIITNADNNDKLQIEQGLEMLNNGVDVLVIFAVNGSTAAQIVREANKRKVKTIAYESLISNCNLDYFITADNEKGGELMTEYTLKLVPKGNYVLLGGDKADKNAVLIKTGQHNVIDPHVKNGNIKILYDVYAAWDAEEGCFETRRFLNLSNIVPDVIIASNDGLATGVVEALKEFGLEGKVPVTGLDGELTAFQRIAAGTQSVTIFKSFKKQAYRAAELAYELANGKKPENITTEVFNGKVNVPTILLEPVAVDKHNLDEVIIKDGVFTAQQIYSSL
jgi:D-xylose transport system substrate-binding protein